MPGLATISEQRVMIFPVFPLLAGARTFRWGKTLQIWLVEGRDYRSPNNMPDGPEDPVVALRYE